MLLDSPQVVEIAADHIGLRALIRIDLLPVDRGVEQRVADTAFAAAVLQKVIIAVGVAADREHVVTQIGIALTVAELFEQPVRRTEPEAVATV